MFTKAQVGTLNDARDILRELEKGATDAGLDAGSNHEAANFGKLAETLDAAEGAIFNVLNIATSHCKFPLTDEQIHNRPQGGDDD